MIFVLLVLLAPLSVSAQLTDLMGNLSIGGKMTAQSVRGYNVANLQMKKLEIQTLMFSNPQNVSRETFSVLGYSASATLENEDGFSITLKGVERDLCQMIESNFAESKKIKINENNVCLDKNIFKFYY